MSTTHIKTIHRHNSMLVLYADNTEAATINVEVVETNCVAPMRWVGKFLEENDRLTQVSGNFDLSRSRFFNHCPTGWIGYELASYFLSRGWHSLQTGRVTWTLINVEGESIRMNSDSNNCSAIHLRPYVHVTEAADTTSIFPDDYHTGFLRMRGIISDPDTDMAALLLHNGSYNRVGGTEIVSREKLAQYPFTVDDPETENSLKWEAPDYLQFSSLLDVFKGFRILAGVDAPTSIHDLTADYIVGPSEMLFFSYLRDAINANRIFLNQKKPNYFVVSYDTRTNTEAFYAVRLRGNQPAK